MVVRVLVLSKTLGMGGAERLIATAMKVSDRRSFDYQVAYVLSRYGGLADGIRRGGVPVHDLGARGDYDLRWLARLRSLLGAGGFDVVHIHLPYAAGLGRLVVRSLPVAKRPRIVYTQHIAWRRANVGVRLLNRLTIGSDDAVLAVSESTRRTMPRRIRRRAEVVLHAPDLDGVSQLGGEVSVRDELGVDPEQGLVLAVANLRPEKGYDLLLKATRMLVDWRVPVKVVAAGAGPLEAELKELHRRLRLGDSFVFLGTRSDAVRLMAGSDLFVLASRLEGLPVSVMEAMASGCTVVATDVGGVGELVQDGRNGRLVPPGDAEKLARAVADLLADPELRHRLATGGRETSKQLDPGRAMRQIEAVYRRVLN